MPWRGREVGRELTHQFELFSEAHGGAVYFLCIHAEDAGKEAERELGSISEFSNDRSV
jgi:hypothetical protein